MAEHSCVRRYRLARLEGMHVYIHHIQWSIRTCINNVRSSCVSYELIDWALR